MATTDRFQVKRAAGRWDAKGPDLLRDRNNARRMLNALMGATTGEWRVKKLDLGEKEAWSNPLRKGEVMQRFDAWALRLNEFVVGRTAKDGVHVDPVMQVLHVPVNITTLPNCSPATSLVNALVQARFPNVVFAGGYVWKTIVGTQPPEWSDHAWGTAVDESEHLPDSPNDATLDWVARMARAGLMDFDYALGSQFGHVVEVQAPDFDIVPSSAASTHLWHVHISVVDHGGNRPPREGGVF